MKKVVILFSMVMLCLTVFAISSKSLHVSGKPSVKINKSSSSVSLGKNEVKTKKKPANINVFLSVGSNAAATGGSYVIQFNSSTGIYSFHMNNQTVTIPAGVYYTVGMAVQSASNTTSHNFSINTCATSYSASGTSAQFNNVNFCGTSTCAVN